MTSLNVTWAKYGCYKCNNYKLLILEVNVGSSDTKTAFQSYLTTNKCAYPGVWKGEGGTLLGTATGNGGTGNPQYLIKPDKTFKKSPTATEVNTAGGNVQHVCSTPITQDLTNQKINSNIALYNVSKDGFAVNVQTEGTYSIAFYSANGQLKSMVSKKHFSTGSHKVNMELNNGFYLVEINNGDNIIREKVIVK